jgi:hypothetical protein
MGLMPSTIALRYLFNGVVITQVDLATQKTNAINLNPIKKASDKEAFLAISAKKKSGCRSRCKVLDN